MNIENKRGQNHESACRVCKLAVCSQRHIDKQKQKTYRPEFEQHRNERVMRIVLEILKNRTGTEADEPVFKRKNYRIYLRVYPDKQGVEFRNQMLAVKPKNHTYRIREKRFGGGSAVKYPKRQQKVCGKDNYLL